MLPNFVFFYILMETCNQKDLPFFLVQFGWHQDMLLKFLLLFVDLLQLPVHMCGCAVSKMLNEVKS